MSANSLHRPVRPVPEPLEPVNLGCSAAHPSTGTPILAPPPFSIRWAKHRSGGHTPTSLVHGSAGLQQGISCLPADPLSRLHEWRRQHDSRSVGFRDHGNNEREVQPRSISKASFTANGGFSNLELPVAHTTAVGALESPRVRPTQSRRAGLGPHNVAHVISDLSILSTAQGENAASGLHQTAGVCDVAPAFCCPQGNRRAFRALEKRMVARQGVHRNSHNSPGYPSNGHLSVEADGVPLPLRHFSLEENLTRVDTVASETEYTHKYPSGQAQGGHAIEAEVT